MESENGQKALDKLSLYLAKRAHSERELRQKLRKNFDSDSIDWALQAARDQEWMPDPNELSQRTGEMLHRKNKGINFINQYLSQKGLPPVSANPELELDKARVALSKKFSLESKMSFPERRKAYSFLSQRGFNGETIGKLLNENE